MTSLCLVWYFANTADADESAHGGSPSCRPDELAELELVTAQRPRLGRPPARQQLTVLVHGGAATTA